MNRQEHLQILAVPRNVICLAVAWFHAPKNTEEEAQVEKALCVACARVGMATETLNLLMRYLYELGPERVQVVIGLSSEDAREQGMVTSDQVRQAIEHGDAVVPDRDCPHAATFEAEDGKNVCLMCGLSQ